MINTADSIQINHWFSEGPSIELIRLQGTGYLKMENIPDLVAAMAIVAPSEGDIFTVTAEELNQVIDLIDSSWE